MSKPQASTLLIVAAFAAVYFFWGTTFLGIRIGVETIPPFLMAGTRFVLAGAIILTVMVLRGARMPTLIQWRSALIVGGLMLVGGNGLLTFVEVRLSSGLAALIVGAIPMWVTLLEWLVFKGKRPSVQVAIGIIIGIVGLVWLINPRQNVGIEGYHLGSIILLLVATVLWAFGGLVARRVPLPEEGLVSTGAELLLGGVLNVIVGLALGELPRLDVSAVSARSLAALIYLIIFGSIVGYTAYIWLMKTVDPSKAATNFYVNPVVAVFMGWLVLDEIVTIRTVIVAAVILLGVVIVNGQFPALRRLFNGKEPARL